ncbi:hypothetical protein ACIBG0_17000 [Nocardia sp. NPDC050630]|uniref:hypothetical protein n=1 Tax=Nocardia sp. NPDC050630 TaxID=3364321 RepID=UPI00378829C2
MFIRSSVEDRDIGTGRLLNQRAAAIVRTLDGDTITLFNPRIVESCAAEDEQHGGCLSFFDLRGRVPRDYRSPSSTPTSTARPGSPNSNEASHA